MQSDSENEESALYADSPQQLCYSSMDGLLSKFSHAQDDVAKIVQQRVPAFVERAIRVMEERDELRLQIENCIGRIFAENQNKYMFNEHINGFYRVDDDDGSIRLVPSDTILMEMMRFVPAEHHEQRMVILRGVKGLIRKQSIFSWVPGALLITKVQGTLAKLFGGSTAKARGFMYVLGAIILKDDAVFDRKVHLWYGQCAFSALETFQSIISHITQSYSPLWNRIRSRMHHSYFPLESVSLMHFDLPRGIHSWDSFHKTIHGIRESIIVSCCHVFREANREKNGCESAIHSLFDHSYTDVDSVWDAYHGTNGTNGTNGGCKVGYVHMDEIIADFRLFCGEKGLPDNLLTPTELKRFADSEFVNVRHKMNAQTLYKAALSTPTFYELFDQFCAEVLSEPPCEQADVEGISSGRLYNTFEAWSQYLDQADREADTAESAHSPPAQQKYPYNMFDAFLHQRFVSCSNTKWRVIAHANADMVRYYMASYQQARKAHLETQTLPKSDSASSLSSLGDATGAAAECPTPMASADFPCFKSWCIAKYGALSLHPLMEKDVACEINNELMDQVV
jgi:hypothetical protein